MGGSNVSMFQCPSFKLDFPCEVTEASTYAFVFSGPEEFKPSVVVKWQKVPAETKPSAYAEKQVAKMRQQLNDFKVLEPLSTNGDPPRAQLLYEWGQGRRTFRQLQVYRVEGERMYTLTGTALNMTFDKYRSQLTDIIASFSPTT